MSVTSSFTERQQVYAAWRDRLRPSNDVIDLDDVDDSGPSEDWSPEALFRASAEIED